MPEYKLVYFPARGKGEFIRYLLAYGKQAYENKTVDMKTEWPTLKDQMIFGQMPVLFVDGKQLAQSAAIGRYLAREFGIDGKTNWEKARADMLVDGISDTMGTLGAMFKMVMAKIEHDDAKFKEAWESFKNAGVVPFMKRYTGFLKENSCGKGHFFVGDSVTWADIAIAEFVDRMDTCFEPGLLADYPELRAHRDAVHALEGISKHVAERPQFLF